MPQKLPNRLWLSPALLLAVIAACGGPSGESKGGAAPAEVRGISSLSGADAYERYCASCHTDGVADWEGRSQLWQAVLFEHASAGYLSMPAKGGAGDAEERAVAAAAEYLLEMTFKDRPVD